MIPITIVIPAFNRPELLRIALQSIDKQTARAAITKVIVSENGLNTASAQICDEFIDLPITYVLQQPQLPVLAHLKWVLSQEQQGYVALLCDDDWWSPYHLELAIRSLQKDPHCIAYFSSFLYADNESSMNLHSYGGLEAMHFGRPDFSNSAPIAYREEDILALTFLITPFHFSAMICDGKILSKAVEIFDNIHPTYADRILWAVLSEYGELLFNPISTALVRLHEEMDSKRYSSLEWRQSAQEGTLRVLALAEARGIAVQEKINVIYTAASPKDAEFLVSEIDRIFLDKERVKWFIGYEAIVERTLRAKKLQRSARVMIRRVVRKIFGSF